MGAVAGRDSRWAGRRARVRRTLAALVAGVALVLTGCSGGSGDSDGSDGGGSADGPSESGAEAPAPGEADALVDDEAVDADRGSGDGGGTAGRPGVQTRQVISVGKVALESEDPASVRDELDRLLGRFGGFVADERTTNDDEGETERSVLTLRVPSRHFAQLMASFDELAEVTSTGREATDVTTEVIDVTSRIRTQEVSLDRLRRFLGEATDVDAMIRLESEIARREADLASLRSQQEYLDDQTSLATVTVTMTTPDAAPGPTDDDPLEDAGFLTGLSGGWNALRDVLVVVATVLGALVPFTVVLGVLGVPLLVWLRTVRRRRTATAPPA